MPNPQKHDVILTEKPDSGWTVIQDGVERLSGGIGLHLTDRDRAEEVADDIASVERVDVWLLENGQHHLVRSYRGGGSAVRA